MSGALQAFGEVDFSYVRPLDSVWTDSPFDVADLNQQVVDRIMAEFFRQTKDPKSHPVGQVAVGTAGVGKTHLVGRLRQRVWDRGGLFVLLDIVGLKDFWTSAALCYASALQQAMPSGDTQGIAILSGIARAFRVEAEVRAALEEPRIDPLQVIDVLLGGLMRAHRFEAQQHRDVFRALYLFCSRDYAASNLAYAWLQGLPVDEVKCRELGFAAAQRAPVDLVAGLSWIMSLSGPTLVAVDQIDALVNPGVFARNPATAEADPDEPPLVEALAGGLTELHDKRLRGMTVVTCIEASWEVLKQRSMHSFQQRFEAPRILLGMRDAESIGRLVAKRLEPAYAEAGFVPPSPTWPFSAEAIETATGLLPRHILMRCEAHRRACVEAGEVTTCDSLTTVATPPPPPADRDRKGSLDDAFAKLRADADVRDLLDESDGAEMGRLLRDMLGLFVRQLTLPETIDAENRSDPAQKKPPLHGRLTFTFHDEREREEHFCFRAIEHDSAVAFSARLKAALTAAGIDKAMPSRRLFLVRHAAIPRGPATQKLFDAFRQAGGTVIDPSEADLKTFVALRTLHEDAKAKSEADLFETWLRAAAPLDGTAFFRIAGLCPPPGVPRAEARKPRPEPQAEAPPAAPRPADASPPTGEPQPETAPGRASAPDGTAAIPVGRRMADGEPVGVPTRLLPRHTAIIAGSGSGKTVLLRRIVEEAALAGIPSIVIDPNNDLSRLGDAWPTRPDAFTAEDDAKARRYRDGVEVVVWTPGLHAGNPLSLAVLPDFAALGDDPDERDQAVAMAAETLGPLAGAKTNLQRGVLFDALRAFAGRGGGGLKAMTSLLDDLPAGVSAIRNADGAAARMANELRAAVSTNPLLRADGPPLDPARLFFGADRTRTRVSVLNLSGLAAEVARQDFVNRLQMTLFGWIKAQPSKTGLLYVVDEAQTFMPSTQPALSRTSGVQLVAQARKYGLGMIVATQAPKGIDNKVVSNCTTLFFGKQNAPATIQGAQDVIAASGGEARDIGRLQAGEFYFATEGSGRPGKVRTPICLSHHPANPPTPEEVVRRARRSRAAGA